MKCQSQARLPPLPSVTKVAPVSRNQASLVVISMTVTLSSSSKTARQLAKSASLAHMVTGVNSEMARAMAAYCLWAGLAPWAQVSVRCGQPIQTRSWGANSAGMEKPSAAGVESDS